MLRSIRPTRAAPNGWESSVFGRPLLEPGDNERTSRPAPSGRRKRHLDGRRPSLHGPGARARIEARRGIKGEAPPLDFELGSHESV